jgi:hypothetical protein
LIPPCFPLQTTNVHLNIFVEGSCVSRKPGGFYVSHLAVL